MSYDPTMSDDELGDLSDLTATDEWLDKVGRREPQAGDRLAEAMNDWLTELSAEYTPPPLRSSVAGRTARGAVAAAVAAVLFIGAGTAAAIPGSSIQHMIFGNKHVQKSPLHPAYSAAQQALARASNLIRPLLPGGVVSAAQRSEALRLLTDAAAAIAALPTGAERSELDAQWAMLLRQLSGLRTADAPAASVASGTPSSPRPMPARPGASDSATGPELAPPSAMSPTRSPNGSTDGSDESPAPGATPTPSIESSANPDGAAAAQPTGATAEDSGTASNDAETG